MSRSFDDGIVIIGGGMVGCGLVCRLSKHGKKSLVIERHNIASGATGHCEQQVKSRILDEILFS